MKPRVIYIPAVEQKFVAEVESTSTGLQTANYFANNWLILSATSESGTKCDEEPRGWLITFLLVMKPRVIYIPVVEQQFVAVTVESTPSAP